MIHAARGRPHRQRRGHRRTDPGRRPPRRSRGRDDATVLEEAGANRASVVDAATADDDVNLLVAQLATTRFDVDTVVARATSRTTSRPSRTLTSRRYPPASPSPTQSTTRSSDQRWPTGCRTPADGDVLEVELSNDSLVDRTIEETAEKLPNGFGRKVSRSESESPTRVPPRQRRSPDARLRDQRAMQDARRLCRAASRTARPLSAVRRARRSPTVRGNPLCHGLLAIRGKIVSSDGFSGSSYR